MARCNNPRAGGLALVQKHGKSHMRKIARRGGRALVDRHGRDYMAELGRKGGVAFWTRYHLRPAGTASFAIVERATGQVKGYTPYKGEII